ncbi:MAG: hypothetical protein ACRD6W_00675, partial [Nitrososphaerales archaeon]
VVPISLAKAPGFVTTVTRLRGALNEDLGDELQDLIPRIASALGEHRRSIRSERYVRSHSPTHPGRHRRSRRLSPFLWIAARWDRMEGIPWSSSGFADRKLVEHFTAEH